MRHYTDLFSTYSIVARDPETGQLGVAVQTHQMSVGNLVPWLLPGIGAVATQSLVNISFGPIALAMLQEGVPAPRIIDALVASDAMANRRQVAVVDAKGQVGAWTGDGCIAEAGHHIGDGYSVQANMMTNPTVVKAMANAYEQTPGDLAARMVAALRAAQVEGGDIRGMQSAALTVVSGEANKPAWDTIYSLRVDEHSSPVEELSRLVRFRYAQLIDEQGYRAFEQNREEALSLWAQARSAAPELEETAFWQAAFLADIPADVRTAAVILRPAFAQDERRAHWMNLLQRLQACGLMERENAAEELIAALE